MAAPFLVPLIAAGTSFLMAKATGASNKTALMSGILGGIGAYGVGQLGSGLAGAGAVKTSSGLLAAGPPTAGQAGMSTVGTALQSPTAQVGIGTTLGTYPAAAEADKKAKEQLAKMKEPFDESKYEQAYAQAQGDLSGIGQRAQYDSGSSGLNQSVYNFGSPMFTAKEGGIAEMAKYREGGVNYLPSKTEHNEKDYSNYVRAEGYVEDGSGTGDKDEDTMLAQLADGEFVSRADAVLGAGILGGANPKDFKEMRRMGSKFFYNQQDQLKRIYDMVS